MENRIINLGVVAEVARALGDLKDSVIFVGGAIVSIYVDDPAADEIRPTQDIDLALKRIDLNQQTLDKKLAELGFHPDMQGHAICTYRYKDIAVDIMPETNTIRGPGNRWYVIGFDSLQRRVIEGVSIQVLSAPCFLATKFEAYNNRGDGDYRTSHDFEDIIYVVDNCITIVEEMGKADIRIREFVSDEFKRILTSPYSDEVLSAHLHPLILAERYPILLKKINNILI